MTDRPMTALPYYGGKALRGGNGAVTRWLLRALPMRHGYAEPFGGMLGLLLARPPARNEVVCDADGSITNWWRAVRAQPDELARMVRDTAQSAHDFALARRILDEPPPETMPEEGDLRRAWAFFVVVSGSVFHGPANRTFAIRLGPREGPRPRPEIHRLADRLRDVSLVDGDAVGLLDRLADREHYAVYVDPPYAGAYLTPYAAEVKDRAALAEVLRRQRGACAVSGYADEWDCLDWRRFAFPTTVALSDGRRREREEVVWANFAPPEGLFA